MSKMIQKLRTKGFTLVELLVVIAIIGILIAIVLPAISDAMFRGQLTRTAANLKNVYNAIVAKESEMIYRDAEVDLWPDSSYTTAREYLGQLFEGDDKIMSTTPKILAAKGVPDASDWTAFKANATACAFRVVQGVGSENYPESAPFIFSRNCDIASMATAVEAADADDVPDEFDAGINPFGTKGFVLITKGGATFAPFKNDMKTKYFTNLWVKLDIDGNTMSNTVLAP